MKMVLSLIVYTVFSWMIILPQSEALLIKGKGWVGTFEADKRPPEPVAMMLFGIGLLGIAWVNKKINPRRSIMPTSTIKKDRRSLKDRRFGKDRRIFSYSEFSPERRSTKDRRFVYFRRCKQA